MVMPVFHFDIILSKIPQLSKCNFVELLLNSKISGRYSLSLKSPLDSVRIFVHFCCPSGSP